MTLEEVKEILALYNAQVEKLIERLDERTINTYRLIEKLEKHQADQNGLILKLQLSNNANTIWRKIIVGVGGGSLTFIIGWVAKLHRLW